MIGALSPRKQDVLAAFAGLLLPLAFAPFSLWPIAIASQALFFSTLIQGSPRRCLLRGSLYGMGMFGAGVWWIQVSVHQFGIPLYIFSVSVTVVFVMFMSCYPALVGFIAAHLRQKKFNPILTLVALWVLAEWIRSWLFTGFPWLSLGYSQIDSPLSTLAPVGGVFLISLAVSISAGFLLMLRTPGISRWCGFLGLMVILFTSLSLNNLNWTEKTGEPLSVALVQGAIPQAIKWHPKSLEPTKALYMKLTEPHWDADLIIWPETAIPAFMDRLQDYISTLNDKLNNSTAILLVGLVSREKDGSYYNSIVNIRNGQRYDKAHLVPFGEYLPFREWLEKPLNALRIPMSRFQPRTGGTSLFPIENYQLGASICYEDAFGKESISALPAAELLVNVSNDAWFGDTIAPHQHLQMARMRALESGRMLLRTTNTGITAVIDNKGNITEQSVAFEPYALRTTAQRFQGSTPYVKFGDSLALALSFLILVCGRFIPYRAHV